MKTYKHTVHLLSVPDLGTVLLRDETESAKILQELEVAFKAAWQMLPETSRAAISTYLQARAKVHGAQYAGDFAFVFFGADAEVDSIDTWELGRYGDERYDHEWVYNVRAWPKTPAKQRRAVLFLLSQILDHSLFFPSMYDSMLHTDNVFYIGQAQDMVRYWETGKQAKKFKQFIEKVDATIAELQTARAAYLGS